MFQKLSPLLIAGFGLIALGSMHAQTRQSVYTNLDERHCRTIKSNSNEAGDYLGRCPGISGYSLLLSEGDLRQNLTVVTPKGTEHSLELWSVVSSGFSGLGPRAEWRVTKFNQKTSPVALIVRYNASENPEKPDSTTSYLVVIKITPGEICVTHKIPPGTSANESARRLADEATSRPCLKTQESSRP